MNKSNKTVIINIKNKAISLKLGPAISKQLIPKPKKRPPENASSITEHCMNCNASASSLFDMRSIIVPHKHLAVKFVECFEYCTGKKVDAEIANPKVCLKCWQQIKADFEAKVEKATKPAVQDGQANKDSAQLERSNVSEEIAGPKSKRRMLKYKTAKPLSGDTEGEDHNSPEITNIFEEDKIASQDSKDKDYTISDEDELPEPKTRASKRQFKKPKRYIESSDKDSEMRSKGLPKLSRLTTKTASECTPLNKDLSESSEAEVDVKPKPVQAMKRKLPQKTSNIKTRADIVFEKQLTPERRAASKNKLQKLEAVDDEKMLVDSRDENYAVPGRDSKASEVIAGPSKKLVATRKSPRGAEPEPCKVMMETNKEIVTQLKVPFNHQDLHDRNVKTRIECKLCSNHFLDRTHLVEHYQQAHKDVDLSRSTIFEKNLQKCLHPTTLKLAYYKCKQCEPSKFFHYTNYKQHVTLMHLLRSKKSDKNDEMKVEEALKSLTMNWYDKHIKNTYECKICKISSTHCRILLQHCQKTHENIDPTLPTESELNMQMFTKKGVEMVNRSYDLDTLKVGYFMCKKCKILKFTDYTEYKNHIVVFHLFNTKELYTCDVCYATFTTAKEFSKHDREQSHLYAPKVGVGEFVCKSCGVFFLTEQILQDHIQRRHIAENFQNMLQWRDKRIKSGFECKICSESRKTIVGLYKHSKQIHKDINPALPTLYESNIQMFANDGQEILEEGVDSLTGLSSLIDVNISYYKCKQCGDFQFTNYHYYKLHFQIAHPLEFPNVEHKADLAFASKLKVNEHQWRDKYIKSRYECKCCSSYYANIYNLFEHFQAAHKKVDQHLPTIFELNIQMFTKDGRELLEKCDDDKDDNVGYYMCNKCEILKFTDYYNYKSHVRTMHLFNIDNSFTCDRCYATFTTEKDYLEHEEVDKHLEFPAAGVGEFKCDYCLVHLLTEQILQDHIERRHPDTCKTMVNWLDNFVKAHIECKVCTLSFTNLNLLSRHVRRNHKDLNPTFPTLFETNIQMYEADGKQIFKDLKEIVDADQILYYKCKKCPVICFSDYHEFKQHFGKVHYAMYLEQETLKCNICRQVFESLADCEVHELTCSGKIWCDANVDHRIECKFCDFVFKSIGSLLIHSKTSHKDVDPKLPTILEKNIQLITETEKQMTSARKNMSYYVCRYYKCIKHKFSHYANFKRHILKVHRFVCNACGQSFTKMNDLEDHRKAMHLTILADQIKIDEGWRDNYVKDRYECKICVSHYGFWSSLLQHCKAVHSDVDVLLPTIFELNMEMYNDSHKLIEFFSGWHENMVAYYKCKQCEIIRFTDYDHFKNHVDMVHNMNIKNSYTCDICYATFTSVDDHSAHERLNQHLKPPPAVIAKFKCLTCKMRFSSAKILQDHQERRHPGTKIKTPEKITLQPLKQEPSVWRDVYVKNRIECKLCNAYFVQYNSLVAHGLKEHKVIRPTSPTIFEVNIMLFDCNDTVILDDTKDCNIATYIKCRKCKILKFASYEKFKNHVLDEHCVKKLKPPINVKTLPLSASLIDAENLWRDKNVNIGYECKVCQKFYSHMNSLLKHCHLLHKDVDPQLPTIFEANIRLFTENATEILVTSNDAPTEKVRFYMCKKCVDFRFIDYHKYKNHIVVVHQHKLKQNNMCKKCCATFSTAYELDAHHQEGSHLPFVTNLKNTLDQWRDKHVKDKIECKICQHRYAFYGNFEPHIKNEHSDIDPTDPTELDLAIEMFGPENQKILDYSNAQRVAFYRCKQCPYSKFSSYRKFKDHVLKGHQPESTTPNMDIWKDKNVPYGNECRFCEVNYRSKAYLASHCTKTHTDIDPESTSIFEQTIQMFATGDKETTSNTAVVYYKCRQCKNPIFLEYANFKKHVLMVHQLNMTGATYTCEVCCATYSVKRDLLLHTKECHVRLQLNNDLLWRDKYVDYIPRKGSFKITFECKLCDTFFNFYQTLVRHCETSHKGIDPNRPTSIERNILMFSRDDILMLIGSNCDISQGGYFKCKQCANLKFKDYRSFKNHVLVMHKQATSIPEAEQKWRDKFVKNDYECKMCPQFYSNMAKLDKHCQTVHKDIDPTIPTLFALNLRMFAIDDEELLESSSCFDLEKVAYYKCIQCETARFSNYGQYKAHVFTIHCLEKRDMMFKCTVESCGATFSTMTQLKIHLQNNSHLNAISTKPIVIETAAIECIAKCEPELEINDIEGVPEATEFKIEPDDIEHFPEVELKIEPDNIGDGSEAEFNIRDFPEAEFKVEPNEGIKYEINEELTYVEDCDSSTTSTASSREVEERPTRKRRYTMAKLISRFKCQYCPAILVSLEELQNHKAASHKNDSLLTKPEFVRCE